MLNYYPKQEGLKLKKNIQQTIIPDIFIKNSIYYRITKLPEKYIIKDFTLQIDDDECIKNIFLEHCHHPNCNPDTHKFCIDPKLRTFKFNRESSYFIFELLRRFNLDACYFSPFDENEDLEYKEMNIIGRINGKDSNEGI